MSFQLHDGTAVADAAVEYQEGTGKPMTHVGGRWLEVFPDDPDNRTTNGQPKQGAGSPVRVLSRTAPGQTPALALEDDILARFVVDIQRAGLAGESESARIVYLSLTSRLLPWGIATNRPVSAMPKGTSSSGKSHLVGLVLRFFPI
jgi:hypothetical protein